MRSDADIVDYKEASELTQTPITFTTDYSKSQKAYQDILLALQQWRVWVLLAKQDIRLRYLRSVLGPFWITISMAVSVYSMGFLYSHLFHMDLQAYYPFLVTGMLGWSLISTLINDLTDTFIQAQGLMTQVRLPYTLQIHRVLLRNLFIFFHNLPVYIPIIIMFHEVAKINWQLLWLLPGLAIIYIAFFLLGILLALAGTRYRDLAQIIKNLTQVIFFLTPVMWNPNVLPEKFAWFVNYNPFYIFITFIRNPLMGQPLPTKMLDLITIALLFCGVVTWFTFRACRSRIIYWL